ncbi:MAG: hypothetical protein ACJ8KU_09175 [Chthoniobacterales bacterium]
MHKDKPPSLFNIFERPVGHVIRIGLLTGFVASVLVYVGYSLVQTHYDRNNSPWSATQNDPTQQGPP